MLLGYGAVSLGGRCQPDVLTQHDGLIFKGQMYNEKTPNCAVPYPRRKKASNRLR